MKCFIYKRAHSEIAIFRLNSEQEASLQATAVAALAAATAGPVVDATARVEVIESVSL